MLSLPALQFVDLLRAGAAQQKSTPAVDLLLAWNGEVQRDWQRRRCTRFRFKTSLRKRWISHYPQTSDRRATISLLTRS